MNPRVSRRSVLVAAGVGGIGLAGAGLTACAVGAYRRGPVSPGDLDGLPRVPEHVRPTDRAALGREEVLKIAAAPAPAARRVELHLTPGEGLSHLGVDVRQEAIEFICDPRRPNLLVEGVTRVTYEIAEVAWQPGGGWPIYRHRAPQSEPAIGMRYAGVPRHQIVLLDNRAVYVGNAGTCGVLDGIQGALRVDVNGDAHDDHRGFYKVLITGYA
jgi:hypothetical protein